MPQRANRTRRPVLIIQHAPHEHPAIVRRALESQGIPTTVVHPYRREPYPNLDSFDGLISLGGPMGANDEQLHPWILQELKLLRRTVDRNLPTVGICLGAQMLARTLGGRVEIHTKSEVGWFEVRLNAKGLKDPLVRGAGARPLVYQWHNDTFHLPEGAELLASSAVCPRQIYRIGDKCYGFQFHPEADHQLVHEWMSVEGVDDEIAFARERSGKKSVQDSATQKKRAAQGEKSSLKITAGIAQLFSRNEYEAVTKSFHEHLESWAEKSTPLELEMPGPGRKTVQLRGSIQMLFKVGEAEFVIFREENTLLWPLRLDFIRKVTPLKRR